MICAAFASSGASSSAPPRPIAAISMPRSKPPPEPPLVPVAPTERIEGSVLGAAGSYPDLGVSRSPAGMLAEGSPRLPMNELIAACVGLRPSTPALMAEVTAFRTLGGSSDRYDPPKALTPAPTPLPRPSLTTTAPTLVGAP